MDSTMAETEISRRAASSGMRWRGASGAVGVGGRHPIVSASSPEGHSASSSGIRQGNYPADRKLVPSFTLGTKTDLPHLKTHFATWPFRSPAVCRTAAPKVNRGRRTKPLWVEITSFVASSSKDSEDQGRLFVPSAPPAGTLGRMPDCTRLLDAIAAGGTTAADDYQGRRTSRRRWSTKL